MITLSLRILVINIYNYIFKNTLILANLHLDRIFFIWVFSFHMDPEVAFLPCTVVADWTLE